LQSSAIQQKSWCKRIPEEQMSYAVSRRRFMTIVGLTMPGFAIGLDALAPQKSDSGAAAKSTASAVVVGDLYPAQRPELVREMVTVAHFNLTRVKELVGTHPSLAKATWDWGFGDWESTLGGASHMGNRPIAEFLLNNGAHPSIFSATMLGQLDVVKAFIAAQPGIQRTPGPHSISLLAHAKAGGPSARAVFEFLQSLGDADAPPEASLPDELRAAILGTYIFGPGPTEQVDVTLDKGKLVWTRKGTTGRYLFHLGDRVFYPGGAPAVRIRFSEDAGVRMMMVSDPDVVLTAKMSG
jgi:hypothetical protein